MMRRNRMILLGLWILSLVGISFYGGPVTYGLFFLLTAIPVFSLLYLVIVMKRFRIYQTLQNKTVVCGAQVPFYFTLQNEDFYSFAGIRVYFFSSFSTIIGLENDMEYELLPLTGIKKETKLVCNYRGNYQVGIKKVTAQDFFRLFSLTFTNRETVWVKVKPKLVQLERLTSKDISPVAVREIQLNPGIPDILVREYRPGDDIRLINWKAAARVNKLMVKKTIGETRPCVGIIMDSQRYSKNDEYFIPIENKILELNLALTLYFLKKNMEVCSVFKQKTTIERYLRNISEFDLYYEQLSDFSFRDVYSSEGLFTEAADCGRLMSSHTVIFILQEWNNQMTALAEILSNNNIPVVAYIINERIDSVPQFLSDSMRFECFRIDPENNLEDVL